MSIEATTRSYSGAAHALLETIFEQIKLADPEHLSRIEHALAHGCHLRLVHPLGPVAQDITLELVDPKGHPQRMFTVAAAQGRRH